MGHARGAPSSGGRKPRDEMRADNLRNAQMIQYICGEGMVKVAESLTNH